MGSGGCCADGGVAGTLPVDGSLGFEAELEREEEDREEEDVIQGAGDAAPVAVVFRCGREREEGEGEGEEL